MAAFVPHRMPSLLAACRSLRHLSWALCALTCTGCATQIPLRSTLEHCATDGSALFAPGEAVATALSQVQPEDVLLLRLADGAFVQLSVRRVERDRLAGFGWDVRIDANDVKRSRSRAMEIRRADIARVCAAPQPTGMDRTLLATVAALVVVVPLALWLLCPDGECFRIAD